jgi:hypothetical protein
MSFFDDASWVLIPEGIKEDVVYAQKPTDGLGDLTFTRASDATRTNSAGVIERTPWNLFQFSEMFSDAYWTKDNSSIGINTTAAPNGTLTADTLTVASTSSAVQKYVVRSVAINNGAHTFSVSVKANTYGFVALVSLVGGAVKTSYFNINTGVAGTTTAGTTSSISSEGNGWYRITQTATETTSASRFFGVYFANSALNSINTVNLITDSFYIWGAQLVEGTDAKPYFATTNRQDVPRLDYRNADGSVSTCPRLLLEPQRTNSIRNSTMVGAVAGTPGTLPTNYTSNFRGFSSQVVGTGTENGIQYFDLRLFGTSTGGSVEITLESNTQIAALSGQNWAFSSYLKLVAGSLPAGSEIGHVITERTVAGVGLVEQLNTFSLTSSLQRFTSTRTLNQATTAFVNVRVIVTSSTTASDFTIRIAAPQMELGAYATTFIPTTTAAVTRLTDVAFKTGVSSLIGSPAGTLFFQTQILTEALVRSFMVVQDSNYATNAIRIECNASNQWRVQIRVAGASAYDQTFNSVGQAFTKGNYKVAFAYNTGTNGVAFYVNGVQLGQSTATGTPSLCNSVYIGSRSLTGITDLNASDAFDQAALFPTRLTDARLAEITTL